MPNENNDSIRYLMKEMDPSEEVLMERSMMEDEDLLIEVECMRQTLNKLDKKLPMVEPPADLTQAIINKAADRKAEKKTSGVIPVSLGDKRIGYIAAAAVVAVGLISGTLLMQDIWGSQSSGNSGQAQNSAAVSVSGGLETAVESEEQAPVPGESKQLAPWIDRNEVLRFQDQFSGQSRAAYDSLINSATKKLTPINDPFYGGNRAPQLQLTGSEQ